MSEQLPSEEDQDREMKSGNFVKEVLAGLSQAQKKIDSKYLYDNRGSWIFEKICDLPEYYPNRAEREILQTNSLQMSRLIGSGAVLVEPGSGSAQKVRVLLKRLHSPAAYLPIEISKDVLMKTTTKLREEFPSLKIMPLCGDFSFDINMPPELEKFRGKKVVFFPGSTIGNFLPDDAVAFLKRLSKILGPQGGLLIGADLKKDPQMMVSAYNDEQGITAAFNLNLLDRLNRELHATFDKTKFIHHAIYNEKMGRIEMHLMSTADQLIRVSQTVFRFRPGETIHTESSYKYTAQEFRDLCQKAKFGLRKIWMDKRKLFCMYYFEKED